MKTVSSPCINVCNVESGVCGACGRSLEQIATWGAMSEEARLCIMEELKQ